MEFYNWKGAYTLPSLSKDEKTKHLRNQEPSTSTGYQERENHGL